VPAFFGVKEGWKRISGAGVRCAVRSRARAVRKGTALMRGPCGAITPGRAVAGPQAYNQMFK